MTSWLLVSLAALASTGVLAAGIPGSVTPQMGGGIGNSIGAGLASGGGSVTQPLRSGVSRAMVAQNFVSGLGATVVQDQTRMRMYLGGAPSTELRVCYGNWAGTGEVAGPGNLVVEAAIELDGPIGVTLATWSSAANVTIAAGATVCSDPVFASSFGLTQFPAGFAVWFRTGSLAVSNAGHPFSNAFTGQPTTDGEGSWGGPAFTSQVNATGPMTTPAGGAILTAGLTPFAVLARYTVPMPTMCEIGDSISSGINDLSLISPTPMMRSTGLYAGNGYVGRAAYNAGNSGGAGTEIYPTIKLGIGGDSADSGFTKRSFFFQYCDHGVTAWGVNDISGGESAATVLANLKTVWSSMNSAGIANIYSVLVMPKTSPSTDGWLTEAGQTYFNAAFSPGGAKDQLNTAETSNVGSNFLNGVITANLTAGGVDPNKWRSDIYVPLTTYTPNVTCTSGSKIFTFSTGTFTAADQNKTIAVAGCGAASGQYLDTILSVQSTTQVTMTTNNAGTSQVAAAETVTYGFPATSDGIHPNGWAHGVLAPVYAAVAFSGGTQLPVNDISWVPTGADWAADFKNGRYYGVNCPALLCYPLNVSNVGVTRTSAAYGVTANDVTGVPIQFGPVTARVTPGRGLLAEKTTINLFATPFAPATQTATVVNATQYTASVVGSGSMVLSGACTGTVTAGSPVTCTTSTTSLTATVSGTLLSMQVETGAVATSPISGTRSTEDVGLGNLTTSNNSSFNFATAAGTLVMAVEKTPPTVAPWLAAFGTQYLNVATASTVNTNKTATLTATCGSGANGHTVSGVAWDGTGRGLDCNGGTIATDANLIGAGGQQVYIGGQGSGGGDSTLNTYVQMMVHYPGRLTGATTPTFQQATTP